MSVPGLDRVANGGRRAVQSIDAAIGPRGSGGRVSDEREGDIRAKRPRASRSSWGRRLGAALALLLVLAVGFGAGFGTGRSDLLPGLTLSPRTTQAAQPTPTAPSGSMIDVVLEAWGIVQEKYVDRQSLQQRDLAYGAIAGLVGALKDTGHSRFLKPEDLKRETTDLAGKFEGIGASVAEQDGKIVIVAPQDGSPAQKAGIQAGDVITAVNGESVEGLALNQVVDKIRGPAGTSVRLTVLHEGQTTPTDIEVSRAQIPVRSVTWTMVPGTKVAHVRLSQFADNTSAQLIEALKAAKAAGATGIVLDLRNNFGGYLHEGVNVASQFLANGNVLIERDAADKRKPYEVKPGGVATQIPMVVLTNGGTASAAEIVAGALQDQQRGPLIGEKTFGAGTVLSTFQLRDGSALLLGTSEWLTPNGRRIWKTGIAPDISVVLPTGKRALTPEEVAKLTPDQIRASEDVQFLRALEEIGRTATGVAP